MNKFTIIQAEVETGILIAPNGERHTGKGERFRYVNSKEEAEVVCRKLLEESPNMEFTVNNSNGEFVAKYQNDAYVNKVSKPVQKGFLSRILRREIPKDTP